MRESGILMPVSSLPGPYGIGCFGKEAFEFVDFLAQAGQKIWQILPLSPTGAFIAAQTRAAPNAFSPEGPKPADAVKSLLLLAFTAPCVKKQNWNDRSRSNSAKIKINFPLNMARACGGHFKSSNCTLNRRYPRHAAHRKIL